MSAKLDENVTDGYSTFLLNAHSGIISVTRPGSTRKSSAHDNLLLSHLLIIAMRLSRTTIQSRFPCSPWHAVDPLQNAMYTRMTCETPKEIFAEREKPGAETQVRVTDPEWAFRDGSDVGGYPAAATTTNAYARERGQWWAWMR